MDKSFYWFKDKYGRDTPLPLSILQLDPVDRAVLQIAGKAQGRLCFRVTFRVFDSR